jgi:hypothetical protein
MVCTSIPRKTPKEKTIGEKQGGELNVYPEVPDLASLFWYTKSDFDFHIGSAARHKVLNAWD